ncbi:MAG: hypothetical protein P8H39_08510 [Thalassotalea sp.]|nr:hypothetical protein [Thalassotalea sp.]
MPLLVLLVISLVSMLLCYLIARFKGVKVIKWVVWGALLGPLAIPFVLFAKKEGTQLSKNN